MKYNAVELTIIVKMRRQPNHWFTTNELADEAHVAWETTDKALQSLFKKGYLVKGKKKDRFYWRLY
jgi:DNA-binding transcriptional regulator YhcF (GntR family)